MRLSEFHATKKYVVWTKKGINSHFPHINELRFTEHKSNWIVLFDSRFPFLTTGGILFNPDLAVEEVSLGLSSTF